MKALLDTDIGSDVDDALALLLLLRLNEPELVGLTTVYGDVRTRAKVARKILDAAEVDAPVHCGAGKPIRTNEAIWHSGTEGSGVLSRLERDSGLLAPASVIR